eukprot:scaffold7897_cov248-Pinguiococcus_pyrenoidosus.AAC.9
MEKREAQVTDFGVCPLRKEGLATDFVHQRHILCPGPVAEVTKHESFVCAQRRRSEDVEAEEQLVHRHAEAEPVDPHVVATVYHLAVGFQKRAALLRERTDHLGAHVPDGAADALHGHLGVDAFRQAEVAHLGASCVVQQDVCRLDVAMHEAGPMNEAERQGDARGVVHDLALGKTPHTAQVVLQVPAGADLERDLDALAAHVGVGEREAHEEVASRDAHQHVAGVIPFHGFHHPEAAVTDLAVHRQCLVPKVHLSLVHQLHKLIVEAGLAEQPWQVALAQVGQDGQLQLRELAAREQLPLQRLGVNHCGDAGARLRRDLKRMLLAQLEIPSEAASGAVGLEVREAVVSSTRRTPAQVLHLREVQDVRRRQRHSVVQVDGNDPLCQGAQAGALVAEDVAVGQEEQRRQERLVGCRKGRRPRIARITLDCCASLLLSTSATQRRLPAVQVWLSGRPSVLSLHLQSLALVAQDEAQQLEVTQGRRQDIEEVGEARVRRPRATHEARQPVAGHQAERLGRQRQAALQVGDVLLVLRRLLMLDLRGHDVHMRRRHPADGGVSVLTRGPEVDGVARRRRLFPRYSHARVPKRHVGSAGAIAKALARTGACIPQFPSLRLSSSLLVPQSPLRLSDRERPVLNTPASCLKGSPLLPSHATASMQEATALLFPRRSSAVRVSRKP